MREKLGDTSKLQWAALVVLVVAIAALLVVLFTQQKDYRTDAEAAGESNASAQESPGEVVEPSVSPSASPTATEASEEAPEDAVDAVTTAAQSVVNRGDDSVINVLGDSTSNTSTEWVYRWAEELGGDAAVTVHTWNAEAGTWYREPRTYGGGDRTITIWNGSVIEGTPGLPLEVDGMIEREADLTILNYGHWGDPDFVSSSLEELLNTLDGGAEDAAPVVLTAQNPARPTWVGYADTNRDAMRAAAEERELPVINIEKVFEDSGDWESLLADEVNPNEDGHQLWAEAVSGYFAD
ncbi:SGNH/GDSL hydrolase family protein [Citricoccus alkalitolerans]|uniref:SGNH/GDSL hydrolase family protein n=1 Tax=Citricoccus alkalitolerans TaxID=246603 RepID=A0ABV8XVT1_9MICC